MKKEILLLFVLLLTTLVFFGQKRALKDAEDYLEEGKLDMAASSIELATDGRDDEKIIDEADTWFIKGKIYHAICKSSRYRGLFDDAAEKAYSAYMRALDIGKKEMADKRRDYKDKPLIITALLNVNEYLTEKAKKRYQLNDFKEALKLYEFSIDIHELPEIKQTDTTSIYFAGLSAKKISQYNKAMQYFDKCIELEYGTAKPFYHKAMIYKTQENEDKMLDVLKNGVEKYPDNSGWLSASLIDYYFDNNREDEVLSYMKSLEKKHPNSASILSAIGGIYERMNNINKAIEYCDKAIGLEPNLWETNYFIAAVYFNKAIDLIHEADWLKDTDKTKYEIKKGAAQQNFKKALPYLEQAFQAFPDDLVTVERLEITYRQMEMWKKSIDMKIISDRLREISY